MESTRPSGAIRTFVTDPGTEVFSPFIEPLRCEIVTCTVAMPFASTDRTFHPRFALAEPSKPWLAPGNEKLPCIDIVIR